MVAQQKMKMKEEEDKPEVAVEATATAGKQPGSPKSRLAMLKRSTAKKTAAAAAASDPFRFQGNGVSFKGKLIGVRDVEAARGDAMCADAMRDAKAAIKAAGAHKQRIQLSINIEGIKITDEKTQTILHNFPVSRISFIARDTTDARAFGFVFGQTDGKYKFYGIKTAQTADHAVLSIRDMFQIVYEMKRKQVEQMKQEKEVKEQKEMEENGIRSENGVLVADLLDLETELQHIEEGVNQLASIPVVAGDEWPGENAFGSQNQSSTMLDAFGQPVFTPPSTNATPQRVADPFGDSFGTDSFMSTTPSSFVHSTPQQVIPSATTAAPVYPPLLSQSPATIFGAQPAPTMYGTPQLWPAPGQQQHHSMQPAFTSTPNFSDTNPFAGVAVAPPPPVHQQQNGLVDPFDTSSARAALAPNMNAFTSPTVNWNLGNENSAPLNVQQTSLPHTHSFQANFSDLSSHHTAPSTNGVSSATNGGGLEWNSAATRKVSSLEEAFTKLVDMNSLVSQPQTKKNPFEHLINPPKVPLNSLSVVHQQVPPMVQHQPSSALVFPGKTNDPFADDFFN